MTIAIDFNLIINNYIDEDFFSSITPFGNGCLYLFQ